MYRHCINSTFSRINIGTVQNIENYDTYDVDERNEAMQTGTAVNKVKKPLGFSNIDV
jgi:hypothetical protein